MFNQFLNARVASSTFVIMEASNGIICVFLM